MHRARWVILDCCLASNKNHTEAEVHCAIVPMNWLLFCVVCLPLSRETYNALTNWLTDARTLASPNIVIILCGNKKDLDADREVTFLEASRFAQENGNIPAFI